MRGKSMWLWIVAAVVVAYFALPKFKTWVQTNIFKKKEGGAE